MPTAKNRGFTLIELIVVISIVAILAAVALPKFVQIQADARLAKMQSALGAMKAAAALAHGQLIARGNPTDFTGNPGGERDVNMEGIDVVFVNGYPSATVIADISGLSATDYALTVGSPATGSVTIAPGAAYGACSLIYAEAAAANTLPTYNASQLTLANCD